MASDKLLKLLDTEIDKVQTELNILQEKHFKETEPLRDRLLLLGELRQRFFHSMPDRESLQSELSALQEENMRLRQELQRKGGFDL